MKNMSKSDEIDKNSSDDSDTGSAGTGKPSPFTAGADTDDTEPDTDELVWEQTDSESAGQSMSAKLKTVRTELTEVKKQRDEYLAQLQRERADSINFRKSEEEKRKDLKRAIEQSTVEQFFPIVDSFDSAMKNRQLWESIDKNWRVGVEYIYSQLIKTFEDFGISRINPTGQNFNPETMEAHDYVASESPPDSVVETLMAGYEHKGNCIRPAKVIVSKGQGEN